MTARPRDPLGGTNDGYDTFGLGFAIIVSLAMATSHLAAGLDPYRNFVTQLVFGLYEAHSRYEGDDLQQVLKVYGVVYFVMAAVLAVVLGFRILE